MTNLAQAIGQTPIVRLTSLVPASGARLFAKLEFMNPGASAKDRMALSMLDHAEQTGLIEPGGTIVEATSGNTGMGLAILAATRGYRCIFVCQDKCSIEKIDALKAVGATVLTAPTVEPTHPRYYRTVAADVAAQVKGAYFIDQHSNPANALGHYETTGPEIIQHFQDIRADESTPQSVVVGIGTGGTIGGIAKRIKEERPEIRVIAVDPLGSIYQAAHQNEPLPEPQPYTIEGVGQPCMVKSADLSNIDEVVTVDDRTSLRVTRQLAAQEGLFAGPSSGMAVAGAVTICARSTSGDVIVLLPDSGARYLSKVYSDAWMIEQGFMDPSESRPPVDVETYLNEQK